jgi:D-beta-D-heptose 7-phosphate kinase/D-beta-D-heptose 1-phosphate adenosyltransferase
MSETVFVIGDVMLDVNYIGSATRIAQEACIPVVNVHENNINVLLGGASNVYNNLLNIGIDTHIITVTGKGEYLEKMCGELKNKRRQFEEKFQSKMHEQKLDVIVDISRCVTTKHRFFVNNKIVFRYDFEDTHELSDEYEEALITLFNQRCDEYHPKIVVLSDYNKGVLTRRVASEIIRISNSYGIKVFIDPKTKDIQKYKGCFMIKPNKLEGEIICGKNIDLSNLNIIVKEICDKTGSEMCLLTLSEDGLVLFNSKSNEIYKVKNKQSTVIDITGAGDVVLAGFIYYYMKNASIKELAEFSNYCGQTKIKNFGTYVLTIYDIFMYTKVFNKFIERDNVSEIIKIIKDADKKIILTNGCFDILHFGHLMLLEKSKQLGDILIVALNTDESIKENKGNDRPVIKLEYRIKQLCALECVDFVVVFGEKTPLNLIKQIYPDFLVKGGDYKMEDIVGKEFAKETIVIPYNDGFSTSNIINNIKLQK